MGFQNTGACQLDSQRTYACLMSGEEQGQLLVNNGELKLTSKCFSVHRGDLGWGRYICYLEGNDAGTDL